MHTDAKSVDEYIEALPEDKRDAMKKLRETILKNLPAGFEEHMSYGMAGYVVPLSIYPHGYHVKKAEPLPFLSLAAQRNYIALYHMGLYGNQEVEEWFRKEYSQRVPARLDMGKSCIRFRNPKKIPFDLIGELCRKITMEEHIRFYENTMRDKT